MKKLLYNLLAAVVFSMFLAMSVLAGTNQQQNPVLQTTGEEEQETPEATETPEVTVTPEVTGTPEATETPEVTGTPEISVTPEETNPSETPEVPEPEKPVMKDGWNKIDGIWYYGSGGNVRTGWLKWKEKWYYLSLEDGAMQTGWYVVKDKWYYSDESGVMLCGGWFKIGPSWYYMTNNGDAVTGWLKWKNRWYYLDPDTCAMKTGWYMAKNKWYYSDPSGAMQSGWIRPGKSWYFMGEANDGSMKSGWLKWKGSWYYLGLPDDGAMKTGFYDVAGVRYYANGSGVMQTGWLKVDGGWYYFSGSGAMQTGWVKVNTIWYYLRENGVMATGWLELEGKTYYLKSSGAMAAGEWMGSYYFTASGEMIDTRESEKGILVAIDAGHQRYQNLDKEPVGPGSSILKQKVSSGTAGVATGLCEYELNLKVSLKLADELISRGYSVYMIRSTNDVNISNAERAKLAAQSGADILIRIHANGSTNRNIAGALTIAPSYNNAFLSRNMITESRRLSKLVLDSFCIATGASKIGVYEDNNMSGINWSTIPVTIMEMGYMSNVQEDRLMSTESYQNKMVQGMANGIDRFFGYES